MALMGCLRVLPKVGFPVVQFNPIQHSLIAVSIVPFAVTRFYNLPGQNVVVADGRQWRHLGGVVSHKVIYLLPHQNTF
jgi:hypothetical protein